MLNRPRKLLYLLPLLFLVFLFSVCILLENDFWGNIFSTVIAFLSAATIFLTMKKIKTSRLYVFLLFLCCLVWGMADLLWLIFSNVLFIDPIDPIFLNFLYTIPNILFTILLTLYIYNNQENWNLQQLLIDIFTFVAFGMVLMWSFIFSNTNLQINYDFNLFLTILYIFLDFFVMVEIGLICFSKGFKNFSTSLILVMLGIFVFAIADFYFAYLDLLNTYKANTIVDLIYIICIILFALGAIQEATHPTIAKKTSPKTLSENLRKPKFSVIVFLATYYILFSLKIFNFYTLLSTVIISVFYWVLTTNTRANTIDKLMLKSEKEMNEQLESLIDQRTKELSLANQHLKEISNKDALTGLYNRRYLIKQLDSLISSKQTNSFALLYIDANRFKPINDSYGHEIGDKVLIALGNRFLQNYSSNGTAFRIGGDEFALIVDNFSDKQEIVSLAQKTLEMVQQPIVVSPYCFTLSASIGIALYPNDATEKDVLMRYAEIAMYEVKSSNQKNNYMFFDKSFINRINKKIEVEFLLQNADFDKEFMLFFQPQFNTKTRTLIGMEALIRWFHPQKGFIPPSEFIPIAEENGMIITIGEWVIDNAFRQIKHWNLNFKQNLRMSINISPVQIKNTGFLDWFIDRVAKEQIRPEWIDLEITETVAMISNTSIENIFHSLNELGVSISIDDFGTGYSSLSYIRKYNIDRLKIAKELIDNIDCDENALLIVQAIIMMAKGMQLRTISEGVEDDNQLGILTALECDEIQGYIYGKPISEDEFEKKYFVP
ncbi:EAL domain-containing protein [Anaerotignum sp.]|uniref:putative bifunctional diguanylate cyclase/phosphodiesterase n=1 Tax=Anaerotignum sp. TaxID=2039241 RepID=UPI00332A7E55